MEAAPRRFHISLWPFTKSLQHYSIRVFRADLMAGLTVAVFAIPQAMAYAMLAGFPPVYGLYSAIVLSFIAALWGGSELVNTGPTNTSALLTAAALLPYVNHENILGILFLFTLLVGVMRLLLGLCKFGRLINYVPESAFLGFTVGAGLLIALGQLHHLMGVPGSRAPWFVQRTLEVLRQAGEANLYTLGIGLATLLGMLLFNRFAKRVPVALLIIILATLVAQQLGEQAIIPTVADISPILSSMPAFRLPLLEAPLAMELLPGALAVAVIGLIEAVSIGQILALRKGQHLNFNQEFFGQGLSHIVGSFFQCIPGSGSFARSTLIEECGGQTRMCNVIFAAATLTGLMTVPFLLNQIPISALAGLLFFLGYRLIDRKKIRRVWVTSKEDALVMIITFLITVFVKIEYGIYAGVLLSALLFIHRASPLKIAELIPEPGDRFRELSYDTLAEHEPSDIVAVGLGGDLFYGQALELREVLKKIVELQNPRVLIVRARRAYSIDYSCWSALFDFAEIYNEAGGTLLLCGVRPDFQSILNAAGHDQIIKPSQVFASETALFSGIHKAIAAGAERMPEGAMYSTPWKNYIQDQRPA